MFLYAYLDVFSRLDYVSFKLMVDRPLPGTGSGITKNVDPTLGFITQNLLSDPRKCTFVRRGQGYITTGSEIII